MNPNWIAFVIERNVSIISRDVISDLHTTEFRMMLTLMVKVMQEIPGGSDILFLTNAAYIQNFDKTPTAKSANPDLIVQCIEEKKRHNSVGVKIVQYHKSPLLIETHDRATEAMAKTRKEFHQKTIDYRSRLKSLRPSPCHHAPRKARMARKIHPTCQDRMKQTGSTPAH